MTEFGGGLSRLKSSLQKFQPNFCRDLVEVPGGDDWKIRRLTFEKPEFCWKLPGTSAIVVYHLNQLKKDKLENQPQDYFYADVSNFVSPVEISLQPKSLSTARKNLQNSLNVTYKTSDFTVLDDINVFSEVICSVEESGRWYRGRICQVSGEDHVLVELVDIGTRVLVQRIQLRPLLAKFGRAPPLCLRCRAKGVSINDLETKDLVDFKKIIESCNALVRVELLSQEEPYLVNLLHPTILGKNICQTFFPPQEDVGKLARYERSWDRHVKKMNEEFDDDEDDHWNHHWTEKDKPEAGDRMSKTTYISRLSRCGKVSRFDDDVIHVGHVENAYLIYLHYPWQIELRRKIEKNLKEKWTQFPPVNQHSIDLLYVIQYPEECFHRVTVTEVDEDTVTVLLVDYGTYATFPKGLKELRWIPSEQPFSEPPTLFIVGLNSKNGHPHESETNLLRRFLPTSLEIRFRWDRKSKNAPFRGSISTPTSPNVFEDVLEILSKSHIDVACRSLLPYTRRETTQEVSGNKFVYRTTCHPNYVKGDLETVTFGAFSL
ncbi:unnamed protein product [Caenorhabditis auriculariae]|uniref:Tudor domain-containing protein n=1 Tax=Caenorhabditis auriculariae TaxID=2777116 RepID=A0A8S1HGY4_9PELO|nr:unnamed protein product [Caenorhabditis auriculariae]